MSASQQALKAFKDDMAWYTEGQPVTISDLASHLKLSENTVRRRLAALGNKVVELKPEKTGSAGRPAIRYKLRAR